MSTESGVAPAQSVGETDEAFHDRLDAIRCLRNAHQHIAVAYAQYGRSAAHQQRMTEETLHAVDWIRRALEHATGARHA